MWHSVEVRPKPVQTVYRGSVKTSYVRIGVRISPTLPTFQQRRSSTRLTPDGTLA